MTLSSTIRFLLRRLGLKSTILLGVFIYAFASNLLLGSKANTSNAKVRTEAIVVDVKASRPSRNGKRRLWVKFAYDLPDGTQHVRRRRFRTETEVWTGQRITVSYRKHRPKSARIVSLNPPPQPKAAPTKPLESPAPNSGPSSWPSPVPSQAPILGPWLIGLITLPLMGLGAYLFLANGKGKNSSIKAKLRGAPRPAPASPDNSKASRYSRSRTRTTAKSAAMPMRKSQVAQRVSWYW